MLPYLPEVSVGLIWPFTIRPRISNVKTPGYTQAQYLSFPCWGLPNQVGRRDGVLMATPKPAQNRINPYNSALGQAMLNADKGAPAMMGGYFQGLEAGKVNQFNADNQAYQIL